MKIWKNRSSIVYPPFKYEWNKTPMRAGSTRLKEVYESTMFPGDFMVIVVENPGTPGEIELDARLSVLEKSSYDPNFGSAAQFYYKKLVRDINQLITRCPIIRSAPRDE
jgi:hypothetical protein